MDRATVQLEANSRNTSATTVAQRVGFAGVANWIARDPDNEPFIFRRFDELTARNLLYRQAEILAIEQQLGQLDAEDSACVDGLQFDGELVRSARSWEALKESKEMGNKAATARVDLIFELRGKLDDYHDALLRQGNVLNLKRPGTRAVHAMGRWLEENPHLSGKAETFLDKRSDLCSLKSTHESDPLSVVMRRYWPTKGTPYHSDDRGIGRFSESHIKRAVAIINVVAAAVLLFGSIVTLYFAKTDGLKLGLVGVLTFIFASCITFMTNARKTEIFAATAAYAAVLVVFVSGEISSP